MNKCNDKGEPHGYWENYHPNGQLHYKGNYLNGKRHGYWETEFYEVNYHNGIFHGDYKSYWDPDKKRIYSKGYYNMGKLIGKYYTFSLDVNKLLKKSFYL